MHWCFNSIGAGLTLTRGWASFSEPKAFAVLFQTFGMLAFASRLFLCVGDILRSHQVKGSWLECILIRLFWFFNGMHSKFFEFAFQFWLLKNARLWVAAWILILLILLRAAKGIRISNWYSDHLLINIGFFVLAHSFVGHELVGRTDIFGVFDGSAIVAAIGRHTAI